MILAKILFLSATILPLPNFGRVPRRGARAYEELSPILAPPASIEANGRPTMTASPRQPVMSVVDLRLVSDATMTRSDIGQDASSRAARSQTFDRRKTASTAKFVTWLSEMYAGQDLSKTRLLGLYFEFSEFSERRPLTERQLLNGLQKHGVRRTRPTAVIIDGRQHRPTSYRVRGQQRRVA